MNLTNELQNVSKIESLQLKLDSLNTKMIDLAFKKSRSPKLIERVTCKVLYIINYKIRRRLEKEIFFLKNVKPSALSYYRYKKVFKINIGY